MKNYKVTIDLILEADDTDDAIEIARDMIAENEWPIQAEELQEEMVS
jgi:hypothetical protein